MCSVQIDVYRKFFQMLHLNVSQNIAAVSCSPDAYQLGAAGLGSGTMGQPHRALVGAWVGGFWMWWGVCKWCVILPGFGVGGGKRIGEVEPDHWGSLGLDLVVIFSVCLFAHLLCVHIVFERSFVFPLFFLPSHLHCWSPSLHRKNSPK